MSVEFQSCVGFGMYFKPGEFAVCWDPVLHDESDEVNEIIDDFVYDLNPYSDRDDCGYFFGVLCKTVSSESRPAAINFSDFKIPHEEYDRAVKAYNMCFPKLAEQACPIFEFYLFSRWC